jgi:hypothetical protein
MNTTTLVEAMQMMFDYPSCRFELYILLSSDDPGLSMKN